MIRHSLIRSSSSPLYRSLSLPLPIDALFSLPFITFSSSSSSVSSVSFSIHRLFSSASASASASASSAYAPNKPSPPSFSSSSSPSPSLSDHYRSPSSPPPFIRPKSPPPGKHFNYIFRLLMKLIHPDLFEKYPQQQLSNSEALQGINSFMETIRRKNPNQNLKRNTEESAAAKAPTEKGGGYPLKQSFVITFFIKKSRVHGPLLPTSAQIKKAEEMKIVIDRSIQKLSASSNSSILNKVNKNHLSSFPSPSSSSTTNNYPPSILQKLSPVERAWIQSGSFKHFLHHYPFTPVRHEVIDATDGEFRRLSFVLSISGGDCRTEVKRFFQTIFYQLNLPYEFQWDNEYWPVPETANEMQWNIVMQENGELYGNKKPTTRTEWNERVKKAKESQGESMDDEDELTQEEFDELMRNWKNDQ